MANTPREVTVNLNIQANLELLSSAVDVIVPEAKKLIDSGLESAHATAIIIELIRAE